MFDPNLPSKSSPWIWILPLFAGRPLLTRSPPSTATATAFASNATIITDAATALVTEYTGATRRAAWLLTCIFILAVMSGSWTNNPDGSIFCRGESSAYR